MFSSEQKEFWKINELIMKSPTTSLHVNKKALFDYEIVQGYEA